MPRYVYIVNAVILRSSYPAGFNSLEQFGYSMQARKDIHVRVCAECRDDRTLVWC